MFGMSRSLQRLVVFGFLVLLFAGMCVVSYVAFYKLAGRKLVSSRALVRLEESRLRIFSEPGASEVRFASLDGVQLAGITIPRKDPKGIIVLCHGYRQSKEFMERYLDMFKEYSLFLFDFRACGQSGGALSSVGWLEYQDVVAAVEVARRHLQGNKKIPLVLFGVSMGAAACLKALALHPRLADAAILDSGYASLNEQISHSFEMYSGLPYTPFFFTIGLMYWWHHGVFMHSMRPEKFVQDIHDIPMFFMHSCGDDFVLPYHSVRLYNAAAKKDGHSRHKLWLGPPSEHVLLAKRYPGHYMRKLKAFLRIVHLLYASAIAR